jgi:acyl-CoA-binding protein
MSTSDSVGKHISPSPTSLQTTPAAIHKTNNPPDRVFVHALATVRRLPRTGSSRPPPSARLRLYGLYKQSMEGDVESILPRPTLPPPSPTTATDPSASFSSIDEHTSSNNANNSLTRHDSSTHQHPAHRYASRDLRTREAQAEIEKWDAWAACAGMSRTEAKRAYIEALIDTMKAYASGTAESRELVGELEFVWGQIRGQSPSGGSGSGNGSRRGGGGGAPTGEVGEEEGDGDSPRRSGMKGLGSDLGGGGGGASSRKGGRLTTVRAEAEGEGRLRVLSPMSPPDGSDVVEGAELGEEHENELDQNPPPPRPGSSAARLAALEAQLRRLSIEIAALREQLSANHMLASSSYSPYTYAQLSRRWRLWYKFVAWTRWLVWFGMRQLLLGAVVLGALVLRARWRGSERRAEEWSRRRWKDLRAVLNRWLDRGAWWWTALLKVRLGMSGLGAQ